MSKISNMLTMLQLLQNGRKYSIKELASKLEVSERMIRSYKDEFELAGIYIESIRGPYGGYVLNQDIKLTERYIKPSKRASTGFFSQGMSMGCGKIDTFGTTVICHKNFQVIQFYWMARNT